MASIAELFVRVRGDVTDVTQKMRGVETSMAGVGTAALRMERQITGAHLSTGKLRQEFQTLARQLTGVHPVVTQLAGVLGEFAVGGPVTLAVIGGVAAMAAAWAAFTGSSRKAREESDKLIKSLNDQARAAYDATVQGQELIKLQAETELQRAQKASGVGIRSIVGSILTGRPGLDPADAEAAANRISDAQSAVTQATKNVGKAWDEANKPVKETAGHVANVVGKYNELRDAAAKVNAEILQSNRDWWKSYIEKTGEAITLTEQLNAEILAARPSLLEVFKGATTIPTGPVDISDSVKIANDQAKKINDAAAEHSQQIQNAIFNSAQIIASTVMQAFNIGGGGRGSSIGSALGGGLGGSWGATLGWAGGPIGAVIGGLAGSFIGGLFDHKKAVNQLTVATRQLTQAMIQNAPGGFKVASYRYDATDVGSLARSLRRNAARGGVNPLLVGT